MATATLLGTGGGVSPMSITLDQAVPANGSLSVCFLLSFTAGNGQGGSFPASASDSQGRGPWFTNTSGAPIVGLAAVDDTFTTHPLGPPFDAIMVGSVGRQCEVDDLGIGDTITVEWTIDTTGAVTAEALAVWTDTAFTVGTQRGGLIEYVNGDGHPNFFGDDPPYLALSWFADVDPSFYPNPDGAWTMLSVLGGWPSVNVAAWYSPGSTVHGDNLFVNVSDTIGGINVDPGGTLIGGPDLVAGNYQFLHPLNPAPTGRCRPCASMLGGIAQRNPSPGPFI